MKNNKGFALAEMIMYAGLIVSGSVALVQSTKYISKATSSNISNMYKNSILQNIERQLKQNINEVIKNTVKHDNSLLTCINTNNLCAKKDISFYDSNNIKITGDFKDGDTNILFLDKYGSSNCKIENNCLYSIIGYYEGVTNNDLNFWVEIHELNVENRSIIRTKKSEIVTKKKADLLFNLTDNTLKTTSAICKTGELFSDKYNTCVALTCNTGDINCVNNACNNGYAVTNINQDAKITCGKIGSTLCPTGQYVVKIGINGIECSENKVLTNKSSTLGMIPCSNAGNTLNFLEAKLVPNSSTVVSGQDNTYYTYQLKLCDTNYLYTGSSFNQSAGNTGPVGDTGATGDDGFSCMGPATFNFGVWGDSADAASISFYEYLNNGSTAISRGTYNNYASYKTIKACSSSKVVLATSVKAGNTFVSWNENAGNNNPNPVFAPNTVTTTNLRAYASSSCCKLPTITTNYIIREANMTVNIGTVTGATQMKIASDNNFVAANWETISAIKIMPYTKNYKIQFRNGSGQASEIFSLTTNPYTFSLSQARAYPATTSVGNKIIFAGGYNTSGYSNVVDIYDTSTNMWTTATLTQGRGYGAATTVGTKALFGGGYSSSGSSAVVNIYDSATNGWTTANLSQHRAYLIATSVGNRAIFAGGSYSGCCYTKIVDIYNSSTNTWSTANLSTNADQLAAASIGTKAIFAGGAISNSSFSNIVNIYDYITNTWTSAASLSQVRYGLSGTGVGNKALFAGGSSNYTGNINKVDIYNSSTNTWSTASLSQSRYQLAAITVGNKAIFAGGRSNSAGYSNRVDIYNANYNNWTTASLVQGRNYLGGAATGNTALFGGGYSGGYSSTVDVYDYNTDSWTTGL